MFSEVRPLSIELYLLLNLAPDLALLGAASRALGLFNARRVLAAGALCAAYAAVAAAHPLPWASLPAQLALLAGISVLMTRRASLRMARCFALSLGCAALVSGGAARLMPPRASWRCPCSSPPDLPTAATIGSGYAWRAKAALRASPPWWTRATASGSRSPDCRY